MFIFYHSIEVFYLVFVRAHIVYRHISLYLSCHFVYTLLFLSKKPDSKISSMGANTFAPLKLCPPATVDANQKNFPCPL